jgi:hypothetical protein
MNFFKIFLVFLVSGNLWIDSANAKRLYLGAGATFFNMGKTTSSSDGATSLPGQIYLPLTLSLQLGISSRFELLPFVSYTPLAVTASDSISKRMLTTGLNLSFRNSGKYRVKGGLGLLDYQISGDGSSVTRSNGTGTSTFYLPGTSVSSKSIFVDVGLTYHFHDSLKLDLDAMILSAFSTARSVSTTLSISKGVF